MLSALSPSAPLEKRMNPLPMAIALSAASFLLAQPGSAQSESDDVRFGAPEGYSEIAECKEFIPIANEINSKIVDYINSPRPKFKCTDFGRVRWNGSKRYSIIRISNPKFCHEKFCFTLVYDEKNSSIVFSTDAENIVDQFKHATNQILSLNSILNHRFENAHDGVILATRGGLLAVSTVNEVLVISITPRPNAGK